MRLTRIFHHRGTEGAEIVDFPMLYHLGTNLQRFDYCAGLFIVSCYSLCVLGASVVRKKG